MRTRRRRSLLRENHGRFYSVQFRVWTWNEIGILRRNNQPVPALPFNRHSEDAHAGFARREVFIAVALDPPVPMKQGKIRPQKTHGAIDRREYRLFESAGEQTGVIQLEVRSAMNSIAADIYKVHVAGHGQCQLIISSAQTCTFQGGGRALRSSLILDILPYSFWVSIPDRAREGAISPESMFFQKHRWRYRRMLSIRHMR
jgi:hypothetical protein